jgi:hypothetical protein
VDKWRPQQSALVPVYDIRADESAEQPPEDATVEALRAKGSMSGVLDPAELGKIAKEGPRGI